MFKGEMKLCEKDDYDLDKIYKVVDDFRLNHELKLKYLDGSTSGQTLSYNFDMLNKKGIIILLHKLNSGVYVTLTVHDGLKSFINIYESLFEYFKEVYPTCEQWEAS